jgi:hypothetical protein
METTLMILLVFTLLVLAIVVQLLALGEAHTTHTNRK